MAIELQALLVEKARQLGASETLIQFQQQFLDSVNAVLDDIASYAETTVDAATSTNTSVDLDSQTYRNLLSMGVNHYLNSMGVWVVENPDRIERQYTEKLKRMRRDYLVNDATLDAKIGDLDEE